MGQEQVSTRVMPAASGSGVQRIGHRLPGRRGTFGPGIGLVERLSPAPRE
jgi:hypothetical protein